jgi:hypothetical protein
VLSLNGQKGLYSETYLQTELVFCSLFHIETPEIETMILYRTIGYLNQSGVYFTFHSSLLTM